MSKTITLPLGMDSADVAVGTLTLIGGRTYQVTNIDTDTINAAVTFNNKPTPHDITQWSGERKWSAFKPHKNTNFPSGLKVENQEIVYDKPTTNFRLSDYGGYSSVSPDPTRSPATDDFMFSTTTGTKTRQISLNLPEIDIRDGIEGLDITFVRTISQKWNGRSWRTDLTTDTTITDSHVTSRDMLVSYRLSNQSSSYTFRVLIWLGASIAKWPQHTTSGEATYNPSTSLSISPDQILEASGNGGSYNITVTSNSSWTATVDYGTWVTINSGSSGTGNGTTNISLSSNNTGIARITTITFSISGNPIEVCGIQQEAISGSGIKK
ncbi:MAG: BACON domain-containing protein [bacterium]